MLDGSMRSNTKSDVQDRVRGPEQAAAFVDESNTGKSTIATLLRRPPGPAHVQIADGGFNVRNVDWVPCLRTTGFAFQDCAHRVMRAGEDVRFGDIDMAANQDGITPAGAQSGACAGVTTLVEGYGTWLGRWFHNDRKMSADK